MIIFIIIVGIKGGKILFFKELVLELFLKWGVFLIGVGDERI